ncbi:hypothetical protein ACFE04_003022 [Oxalis oulophora]
MANRFYYFTVIFLLYITTTTTTISPSSQFNELYFPGFKQTNNLTLTGTAQVQQTGILRLTNYTSRLMGHAFYTQPINMKNTASGKVLSFSTSFVISIVPEYPKLGGHGLAFVFSNTKDLQQQALPSQYLGLLNATDVGNFTNHLFAVEFDTVQDFEFGDINDNHIGIDINSLRSNASVTAAYYTDAFNKQNLTLKNGKPVQVWIDYDSVKSLINVTISPNSTKPKLPILSFGLDLSPIFEDFMYVGFSASTGLLASSHYVLGWSFNINGPAKALEISSLPSLPGQKANSRTGLAIGLSLASVVIMVLLTLVVIYYLRKIKNADKIEEWELDVGPTRYSYQELKQATKKFSDKELLGRGGFGQVYKGPDITLNWQQRFKIIKDVASALLYLHEGYEQIVIHRDIKSSNVLLDSELNGRVGDFGLARLYEHGTNPGTTRVVGTLGYLAPELPRTGKADTSSDVFAFGAVLLEIACGRRPIEPKAPPEDLVLVDCVWNRFKERKLLDVVDPRLMGDFDEHEMMMVLKMGLMCSNNVMTARPTIRQIVRYLEGEVLMPENVKPPSGGGDVEGFDAFLNSFESTSFDGINPFSFVDHGGTSFASLPTSSLSLINGRD